jgi:transcriptional regulator with XRE-family HTH domain
MQSAIGEQVRTHRLRLGLTQERLAHLVGRSERWLIEVERGEVDPRLSDALALARALRVGVAELTGEPSARPPRLPGDGPWRSRPFERSDG